ncbi:glycosyltransferase family 2 protein [Luteibaculum oceani]|uniref:Glycosyltransferase family 2 protein n=2 Tax=Luteibaculum oceani TaxID=1294296 RepID=A0A5C6VP07_9FLAO|nr:glycosyltransferase family 2 protein [Luteibaculum oceani]
MLSYLTVSILSIATIRTYFKRKSFTDTDSLLRSNIAPGISVLAPAYNEGETVVENVRSLLALKYPNFNVIVINDGSTDDTLQKCIEAFDLQADYFAVRQTVKTQKVKAVYRSRNRSFNRLIVVDKVNGGKADALNVGLNISEMPYVTCIDVDCILTEDALLKLTKPFVDETDKKVIASGGVVRVANGCEIQDGKILGVRAPKKMIARYQAMEYLRTFLLGRVGWTYFDGMMLISGAIGIFDRELALKVKGYDERTVGEDMEIVIRMRKYMMRKKLAYKVSFVPDPLCWTEVPESWKSLAKQRNRWTRGTIETLRMHKDILFNPRYKRMGLLSYPYWVIFEWLAPLFEIFGIVITFYLALFGVLNIPYFLAMIFLVYSFSVTYSMIALLIEELTFYQYHRLRDILKLFAAALTEPFVFHPYILYCALRGNYDFLVGKKTWEKFERKGFTAEARQVNAPEYGNQKRVQTR